MEESCTGLGMYAAQGVPLMHRFDINRFECEYAHGIAAAKFNDQGSRE